jgi:hypothetical protein
VLEELEKRNPHDAKWQRKSRMGSLLTEKNGHPHVEKLVAVMTTLFEISDNRTEFWRHYNKKFKKADDQLEFELLNLAPPQPSPCRLTLFRRDHGARIPPPYFYVKAIFLC